MNAHIVGLQMRKSLIQMLTTNPYQDLSIPKRFNTIPST